jgi:hypothetical protein
MSGAVRDEAGEPVVGIRTLLRSMVVNGRRPAPAQSAVPTTADAYGGLSPGAYAYVRSSTTSLPVTTVEEYDSR